jgi:hypothetical protein
LIDNDLGELDVRPALHHVKDADSIGATMVMRESFGQDDRVDATTALLDAIVALLTGRKRRHSSAMSEWPAMERLGALPERPEVAVQRGRERPLLRSPTRSNASGPGLEPHAPNARCIFLAGHSKVAIAGLEPARSRLVARETEAAESRRSVSSKLTSVALAR